MEHWAEEYECAMMFLDDKGIPTHDNEGEKLSCVGRISAISPAPADELLREIQKDAKRFRDWNVNGHFCDATKAVQSIYDKIESHLQEK
jgi:hypothetical protein